jgi:hypothetical protein
VAKKFKGPKNFGAVFDAAHLISDFNFDCTVEEFKEPEPKKTVHFDENI